MSLVSRQKYAEKRTQCEGSLVNCSTQEDQRPQSTHKTARTLDETRHLHNQTFANGQREVYFYIHEIVQKPGHHQDIFSTKHIWIHVMMLNIHQLGNELSLTHSDSVNHVLLLKVCFTASSIALPIGVPNMQSLHSLYAVSIDCQPHRWQQPCLTA